MHGEGWFGVRLFVGGLISVFAGATVLFMDMMLQTPELAMFVGMIIGLGLLFFIVGHVALWLGETFL